MHSAIFTHPTVQYSLIHTVQFLLKHTVQFSPGPMSQCNFHSALVFKSSLVSVYFSLKIYICHEKRNRNRNRGQNLTNFCIFTQSRCNFHSSPQWNFHSSLKNVYVMIFLLKTGLCIKIDFYA